MEEFKVLAGAGPDRCVMVRHHPPKFPTFPMPQTRLETVICPATDDTAFLLKTMAAKTIG